MKLEYPDDEGRILIPPFCDYDIIIFYWGNTFIDNEPLIHKQINLNIKPIQEIITKDSSIESNTICNHCHFNKNSTRK